MPDEGRRLLISGVVQGVGFRYYLTREARRLGLSGWVRNRRDGTVEALAGGSGEALAALIAWCRHGPPDAQVEHVAVEAAEPPSGEFVQVSTL